MGVLRILGPNGDTRIDWHASVPAEVDDVRARFDEIIREGYLVFELDEQTRQGRQVRTFDPQSTQLRAFRPLSGG